MKKDRNDSVPVEANFEEAVSATGFGKFNTILLFLLIPCSFTQAFEHMGLSYIMPAAECDLNLTLERKSLITSITFIGMITSAFIMGIVCDFFGRRKVIVWGFMLHSLTCIIAATSQNFLSLMIAKFFAGFIFNGPFSATTTFLSEIHSADYRARVQLARGVTFALGFALLPLVSWAILPLKIDFLLFGYFNIHSWNLYMLCCTIGPVTAAIGFYFMPESPKFLMSNGQNDQAFLVFQRVFSCNTGKSKNEYPVAKLKEEMATTEGMIPKSPMKQFLENMTPLFTLPIFLKICLVSTTAYLILISISTLKFWLPQILHSTNNYEQSINGTSFSVCNIMNTISHSGDQLRDETCHVNIDPSVYTNALFVSLPEVLIFAVSGFIINFIGKNLLVAILASIASVISIGIYFAPNVPILIILMAMYVSFLDLCGVIIITITLEVFNTHFRAIAVSFHFTTARLGSISGNMLFPLLVNLGCLSPFLFCSILTAIIPLLMIIYPNTDNKPLI